MVEITKQTDLSGRVVIPVEIFSKLGIERGNPLKFVISKEHIELCAATQICPVCGKESDLHEQYHICEDCIRRIRSRK